MQASSTPERWEQVQRLFDEVLSLPQEDRAAWLDQACEGDDDLRQQVEGLLGSHSQTDIVARDGRSLVRPGDASASQTGRHFAQYEVLDRLGGGGMGEVYRAIDTKLDRHVALKFLSPIMSQNESAKARFVQEAKAASALDHPNIGTVHEIGESGGQMFIAMSLYEGETLKQKIEKGPLPPAVALDYAIQIARGLAEAHENGIIHRDIKPANIIITQSRGTYDGLAKIVDFGLAKVDDVQLTQTGSTLGTVSYMSPEQAQTGEIDHRSDIWSLGVVFYEMLAGQRPFRGDFQHAVIYAIVNEEPGSLLEIEPGLPGVLDTVVSACLAKELDDRYASMTDLLADLETLRQGNEAESSPTMHLPRKANSRSRSKGAPWHARKDVRLGLLAAILLIPALIFFVAKQVTALPDEMVLAVLPFDNVGNDEANQAFIDGLVYTVSSKLTEMEQFQEALSVIPANDVMQAGALTTAQAASQFDVNLIMSGSVQRSSSGIRVTLNLTDAQTSRPISSRTLDLPLLDMAALQDGVVIELASLLEVELNPASQEALTAGGTEDPRAFEAYTRAQGYLQLFDDEANIDFAVGLFDLAIQADSTYALAYAGLGESYLKKYKATLDPDLVNSAIENGERAVQLNDELGQVHATLGMIYFETGSEDKAELALLRALQLEPLNAYAHHQLGWVYRQQNKNEQAEESFERAIQYKNDYWLFHNDLAQLYHNSGRHAEAIPVFQRVIALQPTNPWGYTNLGVQYQRMGEYEQAKRWYQEATQVNPATILPTARAYFNLGGIHYVQDDFEQAVEMYRNVINIRDRDIGGWKMLGFALLQANDQAGMLDAFNRVLALADERFSVNPSDLGVLVNSMEVLALMGREAESQAALREVTNSGFRDRDVFSSISQTYEVLGDRDAAIFYLEEAFREGLTPASIEGEALFDNLRTDQRYADLVASYQ